MSLRNEDLGLVRWVTTQDVMDELNITNDAAVKIMKLLGAKKIGYTLRVEWFIFETYLHDEWKEYLKW